MEKTCAREGCPVVFTTPDPPNVGSDRKYCSPYCKNKAGKRDVDLLILKSGDRVGRLVLIRPYSSGSHQTWLCQCDCGKEHVARSDKLKVGRIKSCGCLQAEIIEKAKKERLARERERFEQSVLTYGLIDEIKTTLRDARRNKRKVLDYHKFELSGTPRKVTTEFQRWVFIVCNVLKNGPDSDTVTVKVTIDVKPT